ncbi:MAG: hypothetical protein ACP5HU_05780 [Phycisphaerae bacterium]
MARMLLIVVALCGIAVGLVQLRRAETAVRHDIQHLRLRRVAVRRSLWDQQVRLNNLTAPREIRRRVERMALDIEGFEPSGGYYARIPETLPPQGEME